MNLARDLPSPFVAVARFLGQLLVVAGILLSLTIFIHITYAFFALGILATGVTWWLYARHHQNHPARWIEVNAQGLRMMPEDEHLTFEAIEPLRIVEWTEKSMVLNRMRPELRPLAAVTSVAPDRHIFVAETR